MSHNTRLNLRAKLVPIPDLKIDLTANRIYARNNSEFFIFKESNGWDAYNNSFNGNFSMSVISIGTSFENSAKPSSRNPKAGMTFRLIARSLPRDWMLQGSRTPTTTTSPES
jgi:cell surface protein SprA